MAEETIYRDRSIWAAQQRELADLSQETGDKTDQGVRGWVYPGGLIIETDDEGEPMILWENELYHGVPFERLEETLWEIYKQEYH